MSIDALTRKAINVNLANLFLGHDIFEGDGATFVRNAAFPSIHDANFVTHVRASTDAEIDSVLGRAEREYAHCKHRCFRVDNDTPSSFEARLVVEGYTMSGALIMLLEGDLAGQPKPCDLRPIVDQPGWDALVCSAQA